MDSVFYRIKKYLPLLLVMSIGMHIESFGQFKNVWMSAGSLHNWYSEIGSELEVSGFIKTQQDGMQWPAIYSYQDIQAARGMWIGAKDFTDENGQNFPYKVITAGPRPPQFYSFFPIKMELIAKFPPTNVFKDGNLTYQKNVEIDKIDGTIPYDRVIESVINSQLGITVTRKIFQFAQQYNDNYIVYEYTFTNTGNTDADPEIELPNNTIKDTYFWWTYRNAINKSVRFVVSANEVGWGINTMNDTRGDGVKTDPANEKYRAQFSWHGYWPGKSVTYDNIGGPIWALNSTAAAFNDKADTVGRLGATQFIGLLTLYADKTPRTLTGSDPFDNDDQTQPATTDYINSDHPLLLAGANALNKDRMTQEYALMAAGHKTPRHADAIEPSGDFAIQKSAPNIGNASGGISFNNGYGPYTLKPGESVRIVMAEAVNGIGRQLQLETGIKYKKGQITDVAKNRIVMQGKDSLMLTFKRITENFKSGWQIPQPPMPPTNFEINSGGDRISLKWDVDTGDPNPPTAFRIYRALGNVDSNYTMIYQTASASERSYDDKDLVRGYNYYYYITAVGAATASGPGTPAARLESGRYYTQAYDAANLQRQSGDSPYSATVKGNKTGPFKIIPDINDKLKIGIDGEAPVDITIPTDSVTGNTRTINDIVKQINLKVHANIASDNGQGYILLSSPTTGNNSKLEIVEIPQSAYSTLGISAGIREGGIPTITEALNSIRIVPNPFNASAKGSVRFPGVIDEDKIAFYNIPGQCTIRIYTELGELIKTIEHTNGSGDEFWYQVTSSSQIVVSGIYIAVITDKSTGQNHLAKFVIIR